MDGFKDLFEDPLETLEQIVLLQNSWKDFSKDSEKSTRIV